LAFVNDQAVFHEKRVAHVANSFKANLHKTTAEKFRALAADIEEADRLLDAPVPPPQSEIKSPKKPIQLSLTMEDIEGLPAELIQELNLSTTDKTEFAITTAIEKAGGIITLSKLLIALYKDLGVIYKRNEISARMARMANKNIIYYVPGKKGVYSIEQLTTEDVAQIFDTKQYNDDGESP
jgi:hypothetical protein